MADPRTLRIELPFAPRPHQRDAHRKLQRFSVLVWHRRAGKTVFALMELILAALAATKPRSRYAYIAPLLKQAKAVAWLYLHHFLSPLRQWLKVNESELWVELPNGARIWLFGADNPDALRGLYFDGIVLDEVAQMRPETWGEVVRPTLMDRHGFAVFIGTPKGTNLFSELYYRALKEPGWYADLRRASDTGAIPAAELEQARREMSEPQWAQEMECDFAAAVENALLSIRDVVAAQERTVGEAGYLYAPKILGVDVARYGDDRNCIFPRQGPVAFKPRVWTGLDLMESAGQVAQLIDKWKPHAVFIDAGGYGAGVIDRLRQLGHRVIGVNFGSKPRDERFADKRAEMWWAMAEWVREVGCLPAECPGLDVDLTGPTYSFADARGRMRLEAKDAMRSRGLPSPDLADALALTFAEPVAIPTLGLPGQQQRGMTHDWNPLARRA